MALKPFRSANGGGSTTNEHDPMSDNKPMEVKTQAIRKKKPQISRVLLCDYNPDSKKKTLESICQARAKRVALCPPSHCPTHFSLEKALLSVLWGSVDCAIYQSLRGRLFGGIFAIL